MRSALLAVAAGLSSAVSFEGSIFSRDSLAAKITEIAERAGLNARPSNARSLEAEPQDVLRQMVREVGKDVGAVKEQLRSSKLFKSSLRASPADDAPYSASALREAAAYRSTVQTEAIQDLGHSYFPTNATMMACLPEYVGAVVLDSANSTLTFSSACLQQNTASISAINGNSSTLEVQITSSNGGFLCNDFYLLATPEDLQLLEITSAGTKSLNFTVSAAAKGWVERNGIRIFRFLKDPVTTVLDLIDTVGMFLPSLNEVAVDAKSAANNIQFLQQYVLGPRYQPTPRANPQPLSEIYDYIQSGDLLMVQRLDGLGVLEDWGTGAVTTHTVFAMRRPNDPTLYITESTTKDAYWFLADGIQTNPIESWAPAAYNATFNVVHIPLSDAARAAFNVTAAWEFVDNAVTNHYPYGYRNFIATFFDTPSNSPYGTPVPWPASAEFVEVVFGFLSTIEVAQPVVDMLIGEGISIRLGVQGKGLTFLQLLDLAGSQGMTFADVVAIPEQDDWVYSTGPSMVCDVYFCNMLKAGGVFGDLADQIQCREFHNLDVYRLGIFDTSGTKTPAICKQNDPSLPYCQLMGAYTLDLNVSGNLNTMAPYPKMNEHCTALPLGYQRFPTMQC